ncbi:50S ribosomal protein L17 [Patescibacteria group bacterium]|nr:50S ribosomal protein L17 [Patescibacteria group bacterium]MBU1703533.1 50S ribosomal protein L17 [Patescibacteria group bacterium]MBU1953440.1 50S ribosomal protein L17 [Patescibacteria group bacterium]
MRHQVRKKSLNMPRSRKNLMMKNLATSLILHEKVKTTQARASVLQPIVEQLIHDAKNTNKVLAIRKVNSYIQSEMGSRKLIEEINKRYQNKSGGYTRITKLGFRAGDAAPLVQIELT